MILAMHGIKKLLENFCLSKQNFITLEFGGVIICPRSLNNENIFTLKKFSSCEVEFDKVCEPTACELKNSWLLMA